MNALAMKEAPRVTERGAKEKRNTTEHHVTCLSPSQKERTEDDRAGKLATTIVPFMFSRENSDRDEAPSVHVESICCVDTTESLSTLAPQVNDYLNRRASRADKLEASRLIVDWLLDRERLLVDVSDNERGIPYLRTDDGSVVPIKGNVEAVEAILSQAGINASEAAYKWIVADLRNRCKKGGKEVRLSRMSAYKGGRLFISCGSARLVVVEAGAAGTCAFTTAYNGHEGVFFAPDGCLSQWTPTRSPGPLRSISLFRPVFTAPHELPGYERDSQAKLLEAWILAAILNIKPLPILTNIGQHSSGKSSLALGIGKLIQTDHELSSIPRNQDDFLVAAARLPVYAIDNMDSEPERWLQDALAQTSTGGAYQARKKYSDGDLYSSPLVSSMIITSRIPFFASRSDILDRVMPLHLGERRDFGQSQSDLLTELRRDRDAILTGLAMKALKVMKQREEVHVRNTRFTDFGKVIHVLWPHEAEVLIDNLRKAQMFTVSDADDFFAAILNYSAGRELKGKASQIVKQLEANGASIGYQGGGKAIAVKLREYRPRLLALGWQFSERPFQGSTLFTLAPPRGEVNDNVKQQVEN